MKYSKLPTLTKELTKVVKVYARSLTETRKLSMEAQTNENVEKSHIARTTLFNWPSLKIFLKKKNVYLKNNLTIYSENK